MKSIIEEHLKNNYKKYVFLLSILVLGTLIGTMVVNNTKGEQKEELSNYILDFVTNIKTNNSVDYIKILKESIEKNIKLVVIIIALSFSIWGEVGNIIIIGYRGFSIGYAIASIITALGIGKGLIFSISLLLLEQIILIPAIILITISCMNTYKSIITNDYEDLKYLILKNTICVLIAIVFIILSSLIQTYLCSNLFLLITKNF